MNEKVEKAIKLAQKISTLREWLKDAEAELLAMMGAVESTPNKPRFSPFTARKLPRLGSKPRVLYDYMKPGMAFRARELIGSSGLDYQSVHNALSGLYGSGLVDRIGVGTYRRVEVGQQFKP